MTTDCASIMKSCAVTGDIQHSCSPGCRPLRGWGRGGLTRGEEEEEEEEEGVVCLTGAVSDVSTGALGRLFDTVDAVGLCAAICGVYDRGMAIESTNDISPDGEPEPTE